VLSLRHGFLNDLTINLFTSGLGLWQLQKLG
jgi:hypothetical protein